MVLWKARALKKGVRTLGSGRGGGVIPGVRGKITREGGGNRAHGWFLTSLKVHGVGGV